MKQFDTTKTDDVYAVRLIELMNKGLKGGIPVGSKELREAITTAAASVKARMIVIKRCEMQGREPDQDDMEDINQNVVDALLEAERIVEQEIQQLNN